MDTPFPTTCMPEKGVGMMCERVAYTHTQTQTQTQTQTRTQKQTQTQTQTHNTRRQHACACCWPKENDTCTIGSDTRAALRHTEESLRV